MSNPEEPESSRIKKNAIGAVVILVVIALMGWQWWSTRRDEVVPSARPVSAFLANWKCLACGNVVEQNVGPGPRRCPRCSKDEMYTTITWACPTHGPQTVFFQYDQAGQPTQIRMGKADWQSALTSEGGWNIKCPACGQVMMPAETSKAAP